MEECAVGEGMSVSKLCRQAASCGGWQARDSDSKQRERERERERETDTDRDTMYICVYINLQVYIRVY